MDRRYKSMFPHLFQEKHQTINNAYVLIIRDLTGKSTIC